MVSGECGEGKIMKTYGVIMAGGGGTRFWPLSRQKLPKQLLNLSGKDLMINETMHRMHQMIPYEDIFIVTNEEQTDAMVAATGGYLKRENILSEPAARNTTACIGYAAMEILQKYGDGIMLIVPSDHYIKDEKEFAAVMTRAIEAAKSTDQFVTIGIKPTFPATGYGYIRYEKEIGQRQSFSPVKEFVEKPDGDTAKMYLEQGDYLWNSGMFLWKASAILQKIKELLPDIYVCLKEIGDGLGTMQETQILRKVYPTIPKMSIDYGIMERTKEVIVLEGDFGWSDVGSWDALESLYEKDNENNICYGNCLALDTQNTILYSPKKLVASLGIQDLILVDTEDAILICHKDKAQDVKKIVDQLARDGKKYYL